MDLLHQYLQRRTTTKTKIKSNSAPPTFSLAASYLSDRLDSRQAGESHKHQKPILEKWTFVIATLFLQMNFQIQLPILF